MEYKYLFAIQLRHKVKLLELRKMFHVEFQHTSSEKKNKVSKAHATKEESYYNRRISWSNSTLLHVCLTKRHTSNESKHRKQRERLLEKRAASITAVVAKAFGNETAERARAVVHLL